MGHRDIWGKDKSKWKKMCPCFDAEAEYADLDNVELGKYDDAGEPADIVMPLFAQPEEKESTWSKIKSHFPWSK